VKIRVAQIRAVPAKGDLAANHRRLMHLLERAASREPDVVVTPECFLDGYVSTEPDVTRESIVSYAVDPASSPYVREAAGWAARNRCWLILGCTTPAPSGGASNAALVFDRSGSQAGSYAKTHLQTHDEKYVAGETLPVFASDFGPFGVMICADRRWPETARVLALKGALAIFNPTYGMHDRRNLHMMQTRSYESEVFIAFTHPRQSLLTGPRGEIVRNVHRGEGVAVTTIDLAEAEKARTDPSAHLRDRRPDLYGKLTR
jgi:predicted amidohydrolase